MNKRRVQLNQLDASAALQIASVDIVARAFFVYF